MVVSDVSVETSAHVYVRVTQVEPLPTKRQAANGVNTPTRTFCSLKCPTGQSAARRTWARAPMRRVKTTARMKRHATTRSRSSTTLTRRLYAP